MPGEIAVNSPPYWDRRFESDWESCGGREQTRWFAKLALANLDPSIADDIRRSESSICDWGCALGDAVEVLGSAFPQSKITGIDVSMVALQRARKVAPEASFHMASSPLDMDCSFGVVFTSNTVEHISRPLYFLRELATIAERYLIVLLPFDEFPRIEEHFHTFSHQSFPPILPGLRMADFRVIDTASIAGTVWQGRQALAVYANQKIELDYPLLYARVEEAVRWTDFRGEEDPEMLLTASERLRYAFSQRVVELDSTVSRLRGERASLLDDLSNARAQQDALRKENESLKQEHETLKRDSARNLADLEVALKRREDELNAIHDNHLWKMVSGYDRIMSHAPGIRPYEIARGLGGLVKGWSEPLYRLQKEAPVAAQISHIIQDSRKTAFFVYPPIIDWDIPLFQRPHHIALRLARRGYPYFFCTPNHAYDRVADFKEVTPNCLVTKNFKQFERADHDLGAQKIFHLYSTDNVRDAAWIDRQLGRGHTILYEYVDEIHEDISGKPIPRLTYERHEKILADERCYVVATATTLYKEVRQHRRANCALITNGVDYDHFASASRTMGAPAELESVRTRGRPIVGYYGALASWMDYDLIRHLARARPNIEVVLIGVDYDRSLGKSRIHEIENVTVLPPVTYSVLPRYGVWFDVCTIPFIVNEITLSTSPIKLFEYMALGKPIVTTALPECRKYNSVLVAEDAEAFIRSIDRAIELGSDSNYRELLDREAHANTWEKKADDILKTIRPVIAALDDGKTD